ncbi:AraC family transcriptional regulator [Phenylobacterium sp.]|uniref:helix-turn-helix domain-containing protein n=1 Tax=Phenylobacterium sp. TaxID=1871053 RepID=UPI0025CFFB48|nr:AraC family transcriptional regulator [Phenylobacterium sp.]
MMHGADLPTRPFGRPPDPTGAFGGTLASHFHGVESLHAATEWPDNNVFAVTRLRSDTGLPDRTTSVVSEPALHISVAIQPVELRSYELWIDNKAVNVPYIPTYHTSLMDLESDPVCWVGSGFDYVHYHLPRAGLDEIAEEHGVTPVEAYRFTICENDTVLAQLTKLILPHIGAPAWTRSLTLDHFSLILGAHVLQHYAGVLPRARVARGGLAPWQKRRAMELIRANLDGSLRLADLARECGLSVSHFTRSFKLTLGVSAHRWLNEQRVEMAKALLLASKAPLVEVAIQSGFSDQSAFTRTFSSLVGASPGRWKRAHTRH